MISLLENHKRRVAYWVDQYGPHFRATCSCGWKGGPRMPKALAHAEHARHLKTVGREPK